MAGALSQYANSLPGIARIGIPDANYYGAERYSQQPQRVDYSNTLNGLGSAFANKKAQDQAQTEAQQRAVNASQQQVDTGGGLGPTGNDFGATASDAQGGVNALAGSLAAAFGPVGAAAYGAATGQSASGMFGAGVQGLLGALGFGQSAAEAANEAASDAAAQAAVGDAMGGNQSGGSLSASDAAAATAASEAASADAAAQGAADAGGYGGFGGTGGVGGGYGGTAGSGDAGTGDGGDGGGDGGGGGDGYAKGGSVANKCLITKASKGGAYEIKALGDFKNEHMRDDPHLSHMADRLSDIAPSVIKHIDAMKNPDATYQHIHSKFIVPASRAITRGEKIKALHLYADLLDYVGPMASR